MLSACSTYFGTGPAIGTRETVILVLVCDCGPSRLGLPFNAHFRLPLLSTPRPSILRSVSGASAPAALIFKSAPRPFLAIVVAITVSSCFPLAGSAFSRRFPAGLVFGSPRLVLDLCGEFVLLPFFRVPSLEIATLILRYSGRSQQMCLSYIMAAPNNLLPFGVWGCYCTRGRFLVRSEGNCQGACQVRQLRSHSSEFFPRAA